MDNRGDILFKAKNAGLTAGVSELLFSGEVTYGQLQEALNRHIRNDCDNPYPEDREANLRAIQTSTNRVLSSYTINGYKLYINSYVDNFESTETVIMLVEEY